MIKVSFTKATGKINYFNITGHAKSAEPGMNDLVCAGASAVVIGSLNALEIYGIKGKIIMKQNKIQINLISEDLDNKGLQDVLNVMIIQLSTIQNNNPKYIKIKEGE